MNVVVLSQIKRYERFRPLHVDHKGLIGGLEAVKPGDCIVAFSRRALYAIKGIIEACTDHKCVLNFHPPCILSRSLPCTFPRGQ